MKKNFHEFENMVKNKKIAVVGIGVSNIPLISMLVKLSAKVTAFDKKHFNELDDDAKALKHLGIDFVLGKDYLSFLKGFEIIFKTPSMRSDSEALIKAKSENCYITSEMEEFIKYCPAKVYGVTGSDGKTTTTSLIYEIFKAEGYKTWVGGNIGNPLLPEIYNIKEDDKVVVELSSFQLMTMDVSPEISIVTNLTPNHLDIHKDMEEYIESKKNIFRFQNPNDKLILNYDNEVTRSFIEEAKGEVLTFSKNDKYANGYINDGVIYVFGEKIIGKDEVFIKGEYNLENLVAAFLATHGEVKEDVMRNVAKTFKGVPHRNEFVRQIRGVKYYNNSMSSSPTRTVAALSAFSEKVILILGGYDKNIPFDPLLEGIDKIKTAILFGDTKYKIKSLLENKVQLYIEDTLKDVVKRAEEISEEGDIVLLAPGCASFDMFKNFEERGNRFKELVMKL